MTLRRVSHAIGVGACSLKSRFEGGRGQRTHTWTLRSASAPSWIVGFGVVIRLRRAMAMATKEAALVKAPKTFCRRVSELCMVFEGVDDARAAGAVTGEGQRGECADPA